MCCIPHSCLTCFFPCTFSCTLSRDCAAESLAKKKLLWKLLLFKMSVASFTFLLYEEELEELLIIILILSFKKILKKNIYVVARCVHTVIHKQCMYIGSKYVHHQAQLAREVGSIHYSKEHDKSLSGIIPSPGQRSRDFILMLKRRISSPLSKTMRCDFNALCGRYRRRVHTFFFLPTRDTAGDT